MSLVAVKAEFFGLSEEDVLLALQDADWSNPVAQEVARLVEAYAENYRQYAARLGRVPETILLTEPKCGVEAVAMRLTSDILRQAVTELLDE